MLVWAEKSVSGDAERACGLPICPWGGKGDSGGRTLPGHAPHFLLGCHPLPVLLTSSAQAVSREGLKAWHFLSARWGDLLSSTEPPRLSLRKQEKGGFERETSIVGGPAVDFFSARLGAPSGQGPSFLRLWLALGSS